jgi:hypothetical protein
MAVMPIRLDQIPTSMLPSEFIWIEIHVPGDAFAIVP